MVSLRKKKKSTSGKIIANQAPPHDWLHQLAFWGLVLLLFFPPYFRGLFFAPQQEKALILVALVFWVTFIWRWLQRDHKVMATPLDWFALALPLVYILSFFVAVNKGLAIEEIVKNILYFLTFWSVSRLIRHEKDAESILKVIYISAVGVAIAGLATATDIVHIKDGFLGGRIYSTFQYPNALAAYLGAVFLIGLYLWNKFMEDKQCSSSVTTNNLQLRLEQWNVFSYLTAIGNFLLLAVLWGTKSRGGLLFFFVVLLLYLLGTGARKRLYTILHFGYLGAVAFIIIFRFIPLAEGGAVGVAWMWLVAGMLLALGGQFLFLRFSQWVSSFSLGRKKLNFVSTALILAAVISVVVFLVGHSQLFKQITEFEYLRNAIDRVYYMETAVEMIKERPLLGWGGGGWKEAYQAYMDYRYTTRQVHSYYFQVGVETGIAGLLAVGGIIASFLVLAHRLYHDSKSNPRRRYLTWTLTMSFLLIVGHALIDFDLSISALTLVLWSLIGIIAGLGYKDRKPAQVENKRQRSSWLQAGAASAAVILVLVGCFCLANARILMMQGIKLLNTNHTTAGMQYMERAVNYNPFNPDYRITLSQTYRLMGEKEKALREANKAVEMSQFDVEPSFNLTQIAMAQDENSLAEKSVAKTLEMAPNEITVYERSMQVYNALGEKELKKGNEPGARIYFEKTILVERSMSEYKNSLSERAQKMWSGPELTPTHRTNLQLGIAQYWLGIYSEAEALLLQAAENNDLKGEACVYLALLKDRQRNQREADNYLKKAINVSPGLEQKYLQLSALLVL